MHQSNHPSSHEGNRELLKPRSNVHFLCIFLGKTHTIASHIHKSLPTNKIKKKQNPKQNQENTYNTKRQELVISSFFRGSKKEKMATMKIPMTVPSPRVDADQLFKAFKGIIRRICFYIEVINIDLFVTFH